MLLQLPAEEMNISQSIAQQPSIYIVIKTIRFLFRTRDIH